LLLWKNIFNVKYLENGDERYDVGLKRGQIGNRTWVRCDNNGVRLSTVGKRAFSVSGATVWNSLPPHSTIDEWQIFVKICFVYIFCK